MSILAIGPPRSVSRRQNWPWRLIRWNERRLNEALDAPVDHRFTSILVDDTELEEPSVQTAFTV